LGPNTERRIRFYSFGSARARHAHLRACGPGETERRPSRWFPVLPALVVSVGAIPSIPAVSRLRCPLRLRGIRLFVRIAKRFETCPKTESLPGKNTSCRALFADNSVGGRGSTTIRTLTAPRLSGLAIGRCRNEKCSIFRRRPVWLLNRIKCDRMKTYTGRCAVAAAFFAICCERHLLAVLVGRHVRL